MNNGEFLAELDKRISLLVQENEYTAERAKESRENVKKIFDVLDNLKCQSHAEQIIGLSNETKRIWKWLHGSIISFILGGGVVVLAVFIGGWLNG